MIRLAFKLAKVTAQLHLIEKKLNDTEFLILDSISKELSFSEISEVTNIEKKELLSIFSQLDERYIEDGTLSSYGKEVLTLNRFVRRFNQKKRTFYIERYKREDKKEYYLANHFEEQPFSSKVFLSKDRRGYFPVKEVNSYQDVKLLFERWINEKERKEGEKITLAEGEKLAIIFGLYGEVKLSEYEEGVIIRNRHSIALRVFPENKDAYLLREISIDNINSFYPLESEGEETIACISIPLLNVSVSNGEEKEIFLLSPYLQKSEGCLAVELMNDPDVPVTELPMNCEYLDMTCYVTPLKFVSLKVEKWTVPIGERALKLVD